MSSFYLHCAQSNICSDGPGAIVKKITYEKSIDISPKIIIIIIVRGKGRNGNNAWTQKHLSLDLASISEKHKKT